MTSLSSISVGKKLNLLVLISFISLIIVTIITLQDYKKSLMDDRKIKTQQIVEVATSLIRIYVDKSNNGELSEAEAKNSAMEAVKLLRYEGENYFWINDMHPKMVMHPIKPQLDGKDISKSADPNGTLLFIDMVNKVKESGNGFVPYMWPKPGMNKDEPMPKISFVQGIPEWDWIIGSGIYVDDVDRVFKAELIKVGRIVLVIFLLVGFLGWKITGDIRKPLARISKSMKSLADNESIEVTDHLRKDEIGGMANALVYLNEKLTEARKLERIQQEQNAQKLKRQEYLESIIKKFEEETSNSIATFASAVTELSQTAESMGSNIDDVDMKAQDASTSSQHTAQNVNTVASASEEMSESIREISSQVSKSTEVVSEAVRRAEEAENSASSLQEATEKIGDVVGLIRDVAEQTNLLALNATIEAARAGEAGKGFSVVASEVKNLASQTTKATEDISKQIAAVQSVSGEVAGALEAIKNSIDNVNQYSGGIYAAVEEQSATTNEISSNMQTAAQEAHKVSESVTKITDSAGHARESSLQTLQASQMLSKEAEQLSSAVSIFLNEVRED